MEKEDVSRALEKKGGLEPEGEVKYPCHFRLQQWPTVKGKAEELLNCRAGEVWCNSQKKID